MAQVINVIITCDLCPDGQSREVIGTMTFGYDGAEYETDLCAVHRQETDKLVSLFTQHARRVTGPHKTSGIRRDRTSPDARFRSDARAWAKETGRPVNAMGRIPMRILTEYRAYLDAHQT